MNIIDGTTQFHHLAELPTAEWTDLGCPEFTMGGNRQMHPDTWRELRELRQRLLREEFLEYLQGEDDGDIIQIVDGCLDVIVIAWGTLLAYVGEEKANKAAAEVVRSNLSKVDGSLGPIKRRVDGKLLKPSGWLPPNIEEALL